MYSPFEPSYQVDSVRCTQMDLVVLDSQATFPRGLSEESDRNAVRAVLPFVVFEPELEHLRGEWSWTFAESAPVRTLTPHRDS